MKSKLILGMVLMVLVTLLASPLVYASNNLVMNGDFENGLQDWTYWLAEILEENGNHYVKFPETPTPTSDSPAMGQAVKFSVGANYVSLKHKSDGIALYVRIWLGGSGVSAYKTMFYFNADGTIYPNSQVTFIYDRSLGNGWHESCVIYYMNEERTVLLSILAAGGGIIEPYEPYEVFIDDVSVCTSPPSPIPVDLFPVLLIGVPVVAVVGAGLLWLLKKRK